MLRISPEPSECRSDCESGWTVYLEQSYGKPSPHTFLDSGFPCKQTVFYDGEEEQGEEEDLSMVSDASSGPPHLQSHPSLEDYDYNDNDSYSNVYFSTVSSMELEKNSDKKRRRREEEDPSFLDDTASSPVFCFSKHSLDPTKNPRSMEEVLDFSQGFSATHLKEKVALQKHLGLLQSVLPANPASSKPIRRGESRNKIL